MPFAKVPTESKNRIREAGDLLATSTTFTDQPSSEYYQALDLANRWRACHAYPINTFQANLRGKVKNLSGEPIVAQRLKRMPTILEKLQRYPRMNLVTMHDIAGVRAILDCLKDVGHVRNSFVNNTRIKHELLKEYDYIAMPRDEDGYRSVHLIYKYNNQKAKEYVGLKIEMQLRTRLQHLWATAVETMGIVKNQALKSRKGDQEWLDFFALVSTAIALREKSPPVPRFRDLSRSQTSKQIIDLDVKLSALTTMSGITAAAHSIAQKSQKSTYHLIILNLATRSVEIRAYDRDSIEIANREYSELEARASKGEQIEPVLVSAGPIEKLRRAYPSFFLDISEFVRVVQELVK